MTEPKSPVTVPEIDEIAETVTVQVTPPSTEPRPNGIMTTKRSSRIVRRMPLSETHSMTTEANRFKET